MDTLEFLRAILPKEGVYLLAVKTDKGMRHKGFTSLEEAAKCAKQLDDSGFEVYHACAAYLKRPYKADDGKFVCRTNVNWKSAKAFWVDIDCGADKAAEGKGYATQREGATALLTWCHEASLPMPLVVNSGNGIHAYWPLSEEVDPTTWYRTASVLKKAMESGGVIADPSRTSDFASILRPVGTHNNKNPENRKPVSVCLKSGSVDTQAFIESVSKLASPDDLDFGQAPAWMAGDTESLVTHIEVESSAEIIATKCKQVAIMRDTQGDVGYDHWRGVIGLISMCSEDIDLAYKWSERRAETGHAQTDVDVKYKTWSSGPTTCEYFKKCNPGVCENCQFHGKVKTPLVLGRKEPESKPQECEGTIEGEEKTTKFEIPELPKGYKWDGNVLAHVLPNKDGVLEAHPITHTRFYIFQRIRSEDGTMVFRCRAHLPRNVIREFSLPGSVAGAGGSKLLELLGQYEVFTANDKFAGQHMHSFIKDSVRALAETQDARQTYTHFGWQNDGSFLLGNRLYRDNGDVVEALLSGNAQDQADAFPRPKGSIEAYSDKLNWIYNREGMEPMQYLICSMWAAPLAEFCDSTYNGIPCAITGADSGKGKTSAAHAALYAFGNALPDLTISGKQGSTVKAQATFLGVLHNLPVLFDEVTNKDARQLSELCYALSNGVEGMRLRSTGGKVGFGDRETWRTHTAMTGNSYIGARLATAGNSEAESMRVFEIRVDSYNVPQLDPMAVAAAITQLSQNVGCAGDLYIKYLVSNRTKVSGMIIEELQNLRDNQQLAVKPKYRFYRNHIACTLAAARIMHNLGVISFDLDKLKDFAMDAVKRIFFEELDLTAMSYEDILASMIADFGPRIITTLTYDIPKNTEPYKVYAPQGIVGRRIQGSGGVKDKDYDGKLYISSNDITKWCVEKRIDQNALCEGLRVSGVLINRSFRITLGKNTTATSAQQRCWEFDANKLEQINGGTDE